MASDGMTNTTPTDLQARMEKLVRELGSRAISPLQPDFVQQAIYEARAIVAELPKPVDPDVLAVREILSAIATMSHGYIRGDYDRTPEFEKALAAYKGIKADRA